MIEAFGGGVVSAVLDYAANTPDYEHHLLFCRRQGHDTGATGEGLFATRTPMPNGPAGMMQALDQVTRRLRPDLVHSHSSIAGAVARASRIPAERVLYTPHCYAFERVDISRALRAAFYVFEKVVAQRGATVVAVSPWEAALAARICRRSPVHYVPNVAPVALSAPPASTRPGTVVTVGRVTPQKGADFFARAARRAPELTWRWFGDGDPDEVEMLRSAGVEVTGWRPREEVLADLATATVYAHSAAWEGAPISLLEGAAYGLPVVARRIQALSSLRVPGLVATPAEMAAAAQRLCTDPAAHRAARDASDSLLARHQPQAQAEALSEAYGSTMLRAAARG